MTQYPYPPNLYAAPAGFPTHPPMRPTSVTVIGGIAIGLGITALLCNVLGLLPFLSPVNSSNPYIEEVRSDHLFYVAIVLITMARLLLAMVSMIGGVGLLGLQRWGRFVMFFYAFAVIGITAAEVPLKVFKTLPYLESRGQPRRGAALAGYRFGVVAGPISGMIFPICVLIVLNRKNVKAAFARRGGSNLPPYNYSQQPPPGYAYPPYQGPYPPQ